MIITTILGLVCVLLTCLARPPFTQWMLRVSFALVFMFLALRYNFGNDYEAYLNSFLDPSAITYRADPGWILLNRLFQPVGFFAMTAVLAFLNCVVYYRLITKYVPAKYYWLAIFLYIFSPEFMLIHSSAMRQSVAIMLFVVSLGYLNKKDAIRYFLCIGLASLFHVSAIILLPVYLLGLFNWKSSAVSGVSVAGLFVSMFVFGESVSLYLGQFVHNYFEMYSVYQDAGMVNTGLGIIYLSAMFILTVYFERFQNKETALLFRLAIMSFMFVPLTLLIALIARVGMYFTPATIIAYPIILGNLKRPLSKGIFVASLLIFTTYRFVTFFDSDVWRDYFSLYQTILEAPEWY